ncbi:MAG: RNA methyltransferase substrate-binding domain-containing protein, partial [Oscillospiraceae bacterium]
MKDLELEQEQSKTQVIAGKNAVGEALKSERDMDSVYILKGSETSMAKVIALAKKAGVPIKEVTSQKLDAMAEGVNH